MKNKTSFSMFSFLKIDFAMKSFIILSDRGCKSVQLPDMEDAPLAIE